MKNNSRFFKTNNRMYLALLLLTFYILQNPAHAQERKLVYDVIKNRDVIGEMVLTELIKDQKKILRLTSDVKTRVIFSISDHAEETSTYQDDVMVYSSYYQKQNGSDKANKRTIVSGTSYKLIDQDISKLITCSPIRYSTLLLYTNIPETVDKVYSGNFQKLLDIKKVKENKYRLTLPDGNHNYYTYKNGVCSRVDIERTFFTVQFVLRENIAMN